MKSKILVLGGTGKTGKRVAQRLENLNIPVLIGSRSAALPFDWDKPENWNEVLADVEKIYITIQPDLASPGSVEKINLFVNQAKGAGVSKLVLLSGRGEKEAVECEDIVKHSGINYTVIRASWFMQNFSESFFYDSIVYGEVVLPEIKALEPFIDADDIAEVAVEALTEDKHSNKTYELTGSELLKFEDAVSIISDAIGRPINYTEVSINQYSEILRSYQIPQDYIDLLTYLFSQVLDGRNEYTTDDIENILGRKPRTFKEFVSKAVQSRVWEAHEALKE